MSNSSSNDLHPDIDTLLTSTEQSAAGIAPGHYWDGRPVRKLRRSDHVERRLKTASVSMMVTGAVAIYMEMIITRLKVEENTPLGLIQLRANVTLVCRR